MHRTTQFHPSKRGGLSDLDLQWHFSVQGGSTILVTLLEQRSETVVTGIVGKLRHCPL